MKEWYFFAVIGQIDKPWLSAQSVNWQATPFLKRLFFASVNFILEPIICAVSDFYNMSYAWLN